MLNKNQVALEIFSSASCNSACKYCYLKQDDSLKELHQNIIKKITDKDEFLKEIKSLYSPDQLKILCLWGAEPTISLDPVLNLLPDLLDYYPLFEGISFSTNLLLNYKYLLNFITKFSEFCSTKKRKCKLSLQVSHDGLFTDENRKIGAEKIIIQNLFELLYALSITQLYYLHIEITFKPTWSVDNCRFFTENENNLYNYFQQFEEIIDLANFINKNQNVRLNLSGLSTLVVPGSYTTEDGKIWANVCQQLSKLSNNNNFKYHKGNLNSYYYRLRRLIDYSREFYNKSGMFSCSAGRSQSQLDNNGKLNICHRSLILNDENNKTKLMKDRFIIDIKDEKELNRIQYVYSCYHDFTKLKIQTGLSLIKELIYSKQIDEIFKDDHLAFILSIFIQYSMGCPAENILNTGSMFISPASLFRIWGNGAFQEILKNQ